MQYEVSVRYSAAQETEVADRGHLLRSHGPEAGLSPDVGDPPRTRVRRCSEGRDFELVGPRPLLFRASDEVLCPIRPNYWRGKPTRGRKVEVGNAPRQHALFANAELPHGEATCDALDRRNSTGETLPRYWSGYCKLGTRWFFHPLACYTLRRIAGPK